MVLHTYTWQQTFVKKPLFYIIYLYNVFLWAENWFLNIFTIFGFSRFPPKNFFRKKYFQPNMCIILTFFHHNFWSIVHFRNFYFKLVSNIPHKLIYWIDMINLKVQFYAQKKFSSTSFWFNSHFRMI